MVRLSPYQLYIRTLKTRYTHRQLADRFKVSSRTIIRWSGGYCIPSRGNQSKVYRSFSSFTRNNIVSVRGSVDVSIYHDEYPGKESYTILLNEARVEKADKKYQEELRKFVERYGNFRVVGKPRFNLKFTYYGRVSRR